METAEKAVRELAIIGKICTLETEGLNIQILSNDFTEIIFYYFFI
jgi:hypothetical protein